MSLLLPDWRKLFVYIVRWGVEKLYKISKQGIEVEDFHAKTERGVKQELNDLKKIKINFKNCLSVIHRYVESVFLASQSMLEDWVPRALAAIMRVRQKIRPSRLYPRCSWKPIPKWARIRSQVMTHA